MDGSRNRQNCGTSRKNDIRDNTIIFFLSDNGGPISSKSNPHNGNGSQNGTWRGGKGDFYEGGLRVPMLANWPAKLPAGVRYDKPVISLDLARTVVELAGGEVNAPQMDGVNLIPFLTGEKSGEPHKALFWRGYNHALVGSS